MRLITRAVIGVPCRKSDKNVDNCPFFTARQREFSSLIAANILIFPLPWVSLSPMVVDAIL